MVQEFGHTDIKIASVEISPLSLKIKQAGWSENDEFILMLHNLSHQLLKK
jgi:hypothetical protein